MLTLHMPFQTTVLYKGLPTHMTSIPPIIRMYPHMVLQSLKSRIAFFANFTFKVTFACVGWHVIVQGESCEELLAATLTFVSGGRKGR